MANDGAFLTVAATPTAEQAAVARAPIGVSDEAMTGAWRVIIARVPVRHTYRPAAPVRHTYRGARI